MRYLKDTTCIISYGQIDLVPSVCFILQHGPTCFKDSSELLMDWQGPQGL